LRKFYVKPEDIEGNLIQITEDQAQHITTVLRRQAGDEILIFDGSGREYHTKLLKVGKICTAEVLDVQWNTSEPKVQITLFQGIPKGEKMDWIVQKCSELGIIKIVPVLTEYAVVRLDEKEGSKKQERWQKIALEACKQCGRAKLPVITVPVAFSQVPVLLQEYSLKLVAYEEERTLSVQAALQEQADTIAYFIGPEGGITPKEHEALVEAGAKSITLGRRILRAETAAVALGTILLYQMGEMNG